MNRKDAACWIGAKDGAGELARLGVPAHYEAGVFAGGEALLKALWEGLEWERRGATPRREYYVNLRGDPYAYGRGPGRRVYQSRPMTPEIWAIWKEAQRRAGCVFDACFLNGYEDGSDHLGWHADDSPEMDASRPIAVASFGAERELWFKAIGAKELQASQALGSGSLLIMSPGMQASHWHRVPKADRPCGPRVSLTFRGWRAVGEAGLIALS